ncbi:hypothetical protein THOM_1584 [Trachipleistophora hominis]|uniref:Uncharacterized protein n=1 Tax=Trachipleistophora hominis TaxID=72359 RepID=L7JVK9_TRAHO|nr:hypothetical protein THOM_1584 [Trachipleistophora hominis]
MEQVKNTLSNKLPLEDDVVERFNKSAAALNERPDLSKVFSSGNKVVKISKKSNVDLLCEDPIKLYAKIEKFFVEKGAERVEQNKAQIEISDGTEANQKTSTANPDQQ